MTAVNIDRSTLNAVGWFVREQCSVPWEPGFFARSTVTGIDRSELDRLVDKCVIDCMVPGHAKQKRK